jgi:hypothetical protein
MRAIRRLLLAGFLVAVPLTMGTPAWAVAADQDKPNTAVLAVLLLFLGGLSLLGATLWWRADFRAWRRHRQEQAEIRAERRAVAAALAADQQALARYAADRDAYGQVERAWIRRRTHLAALLHAAEYGVGSVPSRLPDVKIRLDERVLTAVPGVLLEERSRRGSAATVTAGEGTVVLTNQRLVFSGTTNREWAISQLLDLQHLDEDKTLLRVANRQPMSGVGYAADADRTRLLLEVAVADLRGERGQVVRRAREQLAAHEQARPSPPQLPAPRFSGRHADLGRQ